MKLFIPTFKNRSLKAMDEVGISPQRGRTTGTPGSSLGCYIFLLVLFTLFFSNKTAFSEIENSSQEYAALIRTYKEWLKLEGDVFKKLTFKLSLSQVVKTGYNAKFILDDNIGRKWLFKPYFYDVNLNTPIKGKVSVIVYRLYKLFGLESPQIHFVTLNINDEKIGGSLQEFIDNAENLSRIPPKKLGASAIDYILKSHVVDWLLANYDAGADNFIAFSFLNGKAAEKIMRIDNEEAFVLLNKDKLKHDWKLPDTSYDPIKYYNRFWEDYLHGKIKPVIKDNFRFIKFVSEFPDDYFSELFLLNSDYRSNIVYTEELKYILRRKQNLVDDFKRFYVDLADIKKETLSFEEKINSDRVILSVSKELEEEINKLKTDAERINPAKLYPSKIDAVFSFEGFICLKQVYQEYWQKGRENLITVCDSALDKIKLLKTSVSNKNQLRAINIYEQEISKIRSGNAPSFLREEINKLIVISIQP